MGPVIDVEFEKGALPKINEALALQINGKKYTLFNITNLIF